MVLVDGDFDGHVFEGFDLGVGEDFAVDDVFDFLQFFVGDLGKVGEVEAETIRMNRGAGLLDVGAEDLAQGGVEQVRAGVVALDGVAARAIDYGVDVIADSEVLLEDGFVGADSLDGKNAAGDLGDGGVAVGGGEPAGVADLAAGVAIEAGVIEDDFDLIAGFGGGNTDAVFDDGEDFGVVGVELLVADEVGLGEIAEGGAGGFLAAAFPACAGAGLFFGAGMLEAFVVEPDTGVACGVHHEVERKAEGLVEMEGLVAGEASFEFFVETRESDLQHAIELLLFCFDYSGDTRGRINQARDRRPASGRELRTPSQRGTASPGRAGGRDGCRDGGSCAGHSRGLRSMEGRRR